MSNGVRHKIDPRLRRRAHGAAPGAVHGQDGAAQVFVEVAHSSAQEWVKTRPWVHDFVQLIDGYCTASVDRARLPELAEHPGVIEVEAVHYLRHQLIRSVPNIHGWDHIAPARASGQGKGVVIGIVDYGLDFTLKDFRHGDGSSRVAYLWDQMLTRRRGERSPGKYRYGVEYSGRDIDRALRSRKPFSAVRHDPFNAEANISGHGTHVAGICAGNGTTADSAYPAGHYVGVAPGATLVFVNLPRRTIVDEVNDARGTLANSVNLAHAVAYCFEKAEELDMPCVVNLSMGFNGGGHDGNMAVEWIMDALLSKSGRAIVVAAGNEHDRGKRIYCGGSVTQGRTHEIGWETGELETGDDGAEFPWGDPTPNELEIWYSSACSLKVQVSAPGDHEQTAWIGPDAGTEELRLKRGEQLVINSDQHTPWGGDARIHIQLNPGGPRNMIRYGTWRVRLALDESAAGQDGSREGVRFDAWIERSIPDSNDLQLASRFKRYNRDTAITLTTPSTASKVITVASCKETDKGEPSEFSGRGPTRLQKNKPDVAAPGEEVNSSRAGAGRGRPAEPARTALSGTSMSTPHVTGLVARLLGRNNYLFADEIRGLLIDSASGEGKWNRNVGWGKVNADAAVRLLEQRFGAE